MADFSTWQRTTLEQFAREATEKLVADRAAIDELVNELYSAVPFIEDAMNDPAFKTGIVAMRLKSINAAINKHTQRKEQ